MRIFKCKHCSRSLIGEWQKGRVYYRCQTKACPTMTIREDAIDHSIIGMLKVLELTEDDLEFFRL